MKRFVTIPIFIAICLTACHDTPEGMAFQTGYLRDYTGLDGCSWVIVTADGSVLEPTNLADFQITLEENKQISFTCDTLESFASICMAGTLVEITTLRD